MVEIQTSTELSAPEIAVCKAGNICLYLPSDWDVNEALAHCEQDLLKLLHSRFKALFADEEFPRSFNMAAERLVIRPNQADLPRPADYFEKFLDD